MIKKPNSIKAEQKDVERAVAKVKEILDTSGLSYEEKCRALTATAILLGEYSISSEINEVIVSRGGRFDRRETHA